MRRSFKPWPECFCGEISENEQKAEKTVSIFTSGRGRRAVCPSSRLYISWKCLKSQKRTLFREIWPPNLDNSNLGLPLLLLMDASILGESSMICCYGI